MLTSQHATVPVVHFSVHFVACFPAFFLQCVPLFHPLMLTPMLLFFPADGSDVSNGRGRLLEYKMTVVTGDRSYAGTDAGVYVQMKGTSGMTREVQLTNNSKKSPFEKGNSDKFKVIFHVSKSVVFKLAMH